MCEDVSFKKLKLKLKELSNMKIIDLDYAID